MYFSDRVGGEGGRTQACVRQNDRVEILPNLIITYRIRWLSGMWKISCLLKAYFHGGYKPAS